MRNLTAIITVLALALGLMSCAHKKIDSKITKTEPTIKPEKDQSREIYLELNYPEIPGWAIGGYEGTTVFFFNEYTKSIMDVSIYPISDTGPAADCADSDHTEVSNTPNTTITPIVSGPKDSLEFSFTIIHEGEDLAGKMSYRDIKEADIMLMVLGKWNRENDEINQKDFEAMVTGIEVTITRTKPVESDTGILPPLKLPF